MGQSRFVHIEVEEIEKETDKAFGVRLADHDELVWLPKSQIDDADNYERGDKDVTLSISEWLARQKELEID